MWVYQFRLFGIGIEVSSWGWAWVLCFFCCCPVSACFTLCCWVPKNKYAPVVHYVAHNPQHQGPGPYPTPQVAGAYGQAYDQGGYAQQQPGTELGKNDADKGEENNHHRHR